LRLKKMADQVVGKSAGVRLPVVRSCEVERDPLVAGEVVLVLLFDHMQVLAEAWKDFADWETET
jgi:hypothetical protein